MGKPLALEPHLAGDPSGDGTVGSADLDLVRANWGTRFAAVPEPGSIGVLFVATLSGLMRHRYRKSG